MSGAALASFELALVLQSYSPPTGLDVLNITRWDPVSRTSLGRFSLPGVSAQSKLALNTAAAGTVDFIQTSSSLVQIRRFNYSSGLAVTTLSTGISSTSLSSARYLTNGNLLLTGTFGGTNSARIYTPGGALVRSFSNLLGTTSVLDATQDAAGNTFVLSSQPGTSSNSKFILASYAANSGLVANTATVTDNTAVVHNSLTFVGGHIVVNREELWSRAVYTPVGTTIGPQGFPNGLLAVPTDTIAAGHDGIIHGFGYDSSTTRMYLSTARANTALGENWEYINSNAYGRIYDSAIVLAPEPGTLLALGAGVGVLLRRRRKKA